MSSLENALPLKSNFLNPPLPTIFCLFSLLAQSLPLPHFFDLLRSLIPQTHHFFSISTNFLLVFPLYSSKFGSVLCQYSQSFENATNPLHSPSIGITRTHSCLHSDSPPLIACMEVAECDWRGTEQGFEVRTNFYPSLNPAQKQCSASSFWKLFHTFPLQLPSYSPQISILKNRSYQMKIPSSYSQTHNPV